MWILNQVIPATRLQLDALSMRKIFLPHFWGPTLCIYKKTFRRDPWPKCFSWLNSQSMTERTPKHTTTCSFEELFSQIHVFAVPRVVNNLKVKAGTIWLWRLPLKTEPGFLSSGRIAWHAFCLHIWREKDYSRLKFSCGAWEFAYFTCAKIHCT